VWLLPGAIVYATGAQYKCYVKNPSEIQGIIVNQQQGRYNEQQIQELEERALRREEEQQAERERAGLVATVQSVLSAFRVTNEPLDAELRKKRITFLTILCTALLLGSPFFFPLLLLAYLCCYYIFVLRLWEEVPREFARTTPMRAAGFSVIPFFALYWMFTALVGLYRDMNKMTESNGLGTRFDPTWIVAACWGWLVLHMSSLFLFTIGVPFLAFLVFFFICMIVTIPMLWIIRKNVLEFIDIKESVGK